MTMIDEDVDAAFAKIDRTEREMATRVQKESDERATAIGTIRREFEEVAVGNSSVLLFGVVWLGIGVILATWSPEIAKIAAGQWSIVASTL